VHSIRVFAKNMGDPYYGPTIVVHDYVQSRDGPSKVTCLQLNC